MKPTRGQKFWNILLVLAVIVNLAVLLLTQVFRSQTAIISFFDPLIQMDDEQQFVVVIILFSISGLMAAATYVSSLFIQFERRPWKRLFLITSSLVIVASLWLEFKRINEIPYAGGWALLAGATFVPILVLWILEYISAWILFGIASLAYKLEQYGFASNLLSFSNRLQPREKQIEDLLGMAYFYRDEIAKAKPFLLSRWEQGERDVEFMECLLEIIYEDQPTLAVEILKDLHSKNNNDRELIEKLIERHRVCGDLKEARQLMEEYYKLDNVPEIWRYEEVIAESGNFMKSLDLIEKAFKIDAHVLHEARVRVNAILQTYPDCCDALKLASELALKDKDMPRAIQYLERLCIQRPKDAPSRLDLIHLYKEQDRYNEMLPHYRILLDQGDPSVHIIVEYIETLEKMGRNNEALEEAENARQKYPREPYFYQMLAANLFEKDRLEESLVLVNSGLALVEIEEKATGLKNLGKQIEEEMKDVELADLYARVQEKPDDEDLFFRYSRRLGLAGRMNRAVAELDNLMSEKPDKKEKIIRHLLDLVDECDSPYQGLSYLADLFLREEKCNEALSMYKKMCEHSLHPQEVLEQGCKQVLKIDKDFFDAHVELAKLAETEQEWTVVVEHLHSCERIDKETFKAHLPLMFYAYYLLQDIERCRYYGKMAIETDPENLDNYIKLADLLIEHELLNEALVILKHARDIDPTNVDLVSRFKKAQKHQKSERLTELRNLMDREPDNAEYQYEMANLLFDQEKYTQAIPYYEKAKVLESIAPLCALKTSLCWANRGIYRLAEESVQDLKIETKNKEHRDEMKLLLIDLAAIFEEQEEYEAALEFYKRVLKIDASFRNVVEKIEHVTKRLNKSKK